MTNTSTQPRAVPVAGRYRLDPNRSSVTFRTRHLYGLAAVSGTFAVADGEIELTADGANPRATVRVTVDATSFSTGNRRRERDVRSPKFLDVQTYPHIAFRAEALNQAEGRWTLAGQLTVRGVTSPVTLAIESVEPAEAGFQAHATCRIDRYAFGVSAAKGMAARYLHIDLTASAARR